MSPAWGVRCAALWLVLAAGCAEPRFVRLHEDGGTIALPKNTAAHRIKAAEMMRARCPQGYVIDSEEEVVVGSVTRGSESTDTRTIESQDKPNKRKYDQMLSSSLTRQTTSSTTTTQDQTEWRINFRARSPGETPPAGDIVQTAAQSP